MCKTGGPSGTYAVSPAVTINCAYGMVSVNLASVTFADNGSTLTITPAINGCCTLTGDSAADGAFDTTCTCPVQGGMGCTETYRLKGTWSGNSWTGTFSATFTSVPAGYGFCFDCTSLSRTVSGTR